MGASTEALTALEVAVRGGGAALARLQLVRVHGQAHGAARLPPFKARLDEDLVETFRLGLGLHKARARHDHGADAMMHLAALGDGSRRAQILDAAIGAGADEGALDGDVRDMPKVYVTKEDYKADIRDIKTMLAKIFDKLEEKADK